MEPPVFVLFREGIVAGKIEEPEDAFGSPSVAKFVVDDAQELPGEESWATQQQHRPASSEIRGAFTGWSFGNLSAPDCVRLLKQSQNPLIHRLVVRKYLLCLVGVRGLLKYELQLTGVERG